MPRPGPPDTGAHLVATVWPPGVDLLDALDALARLAREPGSRDDMVRLGGIVDRHWSGSAVVSRTGLWQCRYEYRYSRAGVLILLVLWLLVLNVIRAGVDA